MQHALHRFTNKMEYTCTTCNDGGYLDFDVYCDCNAGVFYETRDELQLQIEYGLLDTGAVNLSEDGYLFYYNEYLAHYNMKLFMELPFDTSQFKECIE